MRHVCLVDNKIKGTGAIQSPYDPRTYQYQPLGRGEVGEFDIEEIVGKIQTKDQNGSSSCGGQAWAYYGEVLEAVATKTKEERSARWIYAHTRAPGGGSAGIYNNKFVVKNGWALEKHATSYENGKPPSEEFMSKVPERTKELIEEAEVSKALSYLNVKRDFYTICNAIRDNYGCIIMVSGEDNGTWLSEFPQVGKPEWNHWVYAGKVKKIGGKTYIGFKNSWGDDTGQDGWQWMGEEWESRIPEVWTLAWDYKPAQHKALLIQTVRLLKQLVSLIVKK